jgi:hypothetical protein
MDVSRIGRYPTAPDLLFESWCRSGGLRDPKTLPDLVGEFVYASAARSQVTALQATGRERELFLTDPDSSNVQEIESVPRIRKLISEREAAKDKAMRRVDGHAGAVYRTLMRGNIPRIVYESAREVVPNPEADVLGFCLALERATEMAASSRIRGVVQKPEFTHQDLLMVAALSDSFTAAGGELSFDRPDIGRLPALEIAS